jgi:hypothetical protein
MHGIHHGDIRQLTSSNWSSFLSWWDMLHGTFRFDVPQEAITIGGPAWHDPAGEDARRYTESSLNANLTAAAMSSITSVRAITARPSCCRIDSWSLLVIRTTLSR